MTCLMKYLRWTINIVMEKGVIYIGFLKYVEIATVLPDVRYVIDVPHCLYEFYQVFMKGLL